MTNLTPSASFDSVQELETTTVALGGPGAPMNVQAQALLNRTQYLFVQLSNLASVATSGDYNSLINRPALGSAAYQSSGAFATAAQGAKADGAAQASALSSVAFSGSYNDLSNKPFASDAPSDGNVYGRKNGAWSIAIEGSGVGVELNNTLQWTANQSIAPTMLTSGTTIPVDASTSNNFALVMTGDCKLSNPTNLKQGMVLNFTIDQDTTGGHAITTDTLYVFENGTPLWNTAASGKNFFSGYYDGTVIRCFSGATVSTQVNSDWNASSGVAKILNKPTLGTASAQNVSYFATEAQGLLADSALQPDAAGQLTTTARRRKVVAMGNITGAVNFDLSAGDIFTAVLIGNVTGTWINLPASGYIADPECHFVQDGTGGRTITFSGSGKWPGASAFVLTPTPGAEDDVNYEVDSSGNWRGFPVEAMG